MAVFEAVPASAGKGATRPENAGKAFIFNGFGKMSRAFFKNLEAIENKGLFSVGKRGTSGGFGSPAFFQS